MPRSKNGSVLHERLVEKAVKRLTQHGYTVVMEAKVGGCRLDALAMKGNEKIGIECLLTIPNALVKEKLHRYRSLTKVIFIVPSYREEKLSAALAKTPKKFFEIISEGVEPQRTIKISERTAEMLSRLAPNKPYDEIIMHMIRRRR